MDGTDAIRVVLARELTDTRRALDDAETALATERAEAAQIRAQNDDLRRQLIRERAERKAADDGRRSGRRWVCQ